MNMEGKEQVNNNELNNANTGGLSNDTILLPYSINRGFDDLFRCYTLGHMALHYYRYGERKDCSWQWDKFKFALSLSVKTEKEKIDEILKFENSRVQKRDNDRSSLDIWELRKDPLLNYPPRPVNEQ